VANHLSVSNVTSHMHPKTAQNLLAHPQNVPTAAATTQPTFQVVPDINNFTIRNGQPVNNAKYSAQNPHCPNSETSRPNSHCSKSHIHPSIYGTTAPSGPWPPSKRASTREPFRGNFEVFIT